MPSPNALDISKVQTCKVKMMIIQQVSLGGSQKASKNQKSAAKHSLYYAANHANNFSSKVQ
jgi:hypothetical protein